MLRKLREVAVINGFLMLQDKYPSGFDQLSFKYESWQTFNFCHVVRRISKNDIPFHFGLPDKDFKVSSDDKKIFIVQFVCGLLDKFCTTVVVINSYYFSCIPWNKFVRNITSSCKKIQNPRMGTDCSPSGTRRMPGSTWEEAFRQDLTPISEPTPFENRGVQKRKRHGPFPEDSTASPQGKPGPSFPCDCSDDIGIGRGQGVQYPGMPSSTYTTTHSALRSPELR